ncbi:MAG: hypothetical protein GX205_01770 [Firmicutes bacterium]|jgi:hypothetical protein|nr:hypothetical protein [Bacillota bacterium]
MNRLPTPFPTVAMEGDYNPAIRLFGLRFIKDQTIVEHLAELLAVVFSEKRIFIDEASREPLPSFGDLAKWAHSENAPLKYRPSIRLNLKLFSFMTCSPVDKRHEIHKEQYELLAEQLQSRLQSRSSSLEKSEVRERLEELLQGFQGAGFTRNWCAQTFYPISPEVLTQETVWNETTARRNDVSTWRASINEFDKYYSTRRRNFLARGGEVIYLQLCNAFATEQRLIDGFLRSSGQFFSQEERDLRSLHGSLNEGLAGLYDGHTRPLGNLIRYIDEELDEDTFKEVNEGQKDRQLTCQWCPRESWPEGYLFAVEMKRVVTAGIDLIDKLDLMMTGCALHILRSLCAQSARYTMAEADSTGPLGFAWLFVSPDSATRQQRMASQRNLQAVQGMLQRALRIEALRDYVERGSPNKVERQYREADSKYGHGLFLSLGKSLGIIVPKQGRGARLVMTDNVVRYLVLALLRPGERCTYDEFLDRLYFHYGIAVEGEQLRQAMTWSGLLANDSVQPRKPSWLNHMLKASGFLTELSDGCSVVQNPFDSTQGGRVQ